MRKFHLEISEPSIVAQAKPNERKWGQFQFPKIRKTENGDFYVCWDHGSDDYDYAFIVMNAVSSDGKVWRKSQASDIVVHPKMKNGNYFAGFRRLGVTRSDYLNKYAHAMENPQNGAKCYFADDVVENDDKTVWGIEIDSKTGEERYFECKINWPFMPLYTVKQDEVFPTTTVFFLANEPLTEIDGVLYAPLYTKGFNSDATNKKDAIPQYFTSGVYIFSSKDGGLTWDYLSQVLVDDTSFNDNPAFEGFDEPYVAKMPDGSFVMLMRTGAGLPSYITRSTDNMKTWSKPQIFDDIGVLPHLQPLKCGVTLASYGRPILKVRATSDSSGMQWQDPIRIPLSCNDVPNNWNGSNSCFYTGMIAYSDNEALLVYSDFNCKNSNGETVKTILCRKITVVFDD